MRPNVDSMIQTRKYELPDPIKEEVRVTFFNNRHHFLEHAEKHFACGDEPWAELLGKETVEKCRQICSDPRVSGLEDVYDRIVRILDEGIDTSIEKPTLIAYRQQRGEFKGVGYCFLTARGFYVVTSGERVRTALFVSDVVSDAPATRFRKAWLSLKKKFVGTYADRSGGVAVSTDESIWVSRENWDRCPVEETEAAPAGPPTTRRLHEKLRQALGPQEGAHARPRQ